MDSGRHEAVRTWWGQDAATRAWLGNGVGAGEPGVAWGTLPPDGAGLGSRTAGPGPAQPASCPWGLSALIRWEAPRVARFAAVYQTLLRLPRRVRRALQRKLVLSLAEVALLLALGQGPAWAATINVDGTTCTLVNAINSANTNTAVGGCTAGSGADTLVLTAASTHTLTAVNNSTDGPNGLPVVTSTITILGKGSTVTRSGATARLLALSAAGNLTIQDLTLQGGNPGSTQRGGAVFNRGALTLINSTISGNSAKYGGGVHNPSGATLTLVNSTISGNTAAGSGSQGGGVDNFGGTAILAVSTVSNNSAAGQGGGLFNNASLTVSHSTISGNTAAEGGGIFNTLVTGTVALHNSTISGNTVSSHGGGLRNASGGTLTVTNSTISSNTATSYGAGVFTTATSILTNSTITGNASTASAFDTGAVDCSDGSLTLVQTLVSGNTTNQGGPQVYRYNAGTVCDTLAVNSYNIFGQSATSGIQNFSAGATDIIPSGALNTLLNTTLAFNGGPTRTHNLVSGGAAVNRVSAANCAQDTDQRGFVRPSGATCDVGAVEFGAAEPSVVNSQVSFARISSTLSTTTDTTGCGAGYAGKLSFQARLTNNTGQPSLAALKHQVATLTNGNKLLTADGGLASVGALRNDATVWAVQRWGVECHGDTGRPIGDLFDGHELIPVVGECVRADAVRGQEGALAMPTPPSLLPPSDAEVLSSVHTTNLPALFAQLQLSLVVSTYQAGKVILVRQNGDVLNTHFVAFAKPMGIAVDRGRLAIGGAQMVWEYHNVPAVAQNIEPVGRYDACYLPRRLQVTGDIDIHEMAYASDGELWVVNTRFGCLCTLDAAHSFYPRWRPSFVSALAPEDRCHLNGLGMVEGRPTYVTALGETDTAGGWRANKANGGLLLDIERNAILVRGLSMPHSPRWHQGRLWLLESGQGSLAVVDLERCTWRTIAQLPGFTRGLDFVGPLAFIGLSQVRETAVFSGIPVVQRLKERTCGVWVVHIETGQTIGFLRFEAGVQEIFAVQVLQGIRYPEMLEWHDERLAHSYVLPDAALAEAVLPSPQDLACSPAFHSQRGVELYQQGQLAEAIAAWRQCLALDPAFPEARYYLGVALGDAEQYDEAMTQLVRVVEAEPERAEAYNSLGYLCSRQRQPQRAITYYEQAITLQPDYAQAHFNLGVTLLQIGDYRRGFAEYEWRWQTGQFTPFRCPHPQWDGQPIPEQTLLIHTEQGAGDVVQFARFLPLAAARCRRLILVGPRDLHPVLATLPGLTELREAGEIGVHEFDCYLPLLSLPRVLGVTQETLPAMVPYLDGAVLRRRRGGTALSGLTAGERRVGLVWGGSPTHLDDRRRSCRLADWLPLLRTPGVRWHSVQKGERARELAELPGDIVIEDLGAALQDWGDLAWVMLQLDLVLSVDTAVAHIAGALGRPVWTLLSAVPDWRWGLAGETTPWYPTMRLFRQPRPGEWAVVVAQVAQALGDWQAR